MMRLDDLNCVDIRHILRPSSAPSYTTILSVAFAVEDAGLREVRHPAYQGLLTRINFRFIMSEEVDSNNHPAEYQTSTTF